MCAQIIPWNYPLQVTARCAAPALAAGNAVIVKPSELASITPLRFAELAEEAGVPRGMIQIATGDGATGAALVEHPGVDHVTFVGSAATGAQVAEACARRLVPIELELGGKSPNVVFADADLDKAIPAIVQALIQNAGQSCSAGSRLLVEQTRLRRGHRRASARRSTAVTIGPGIEDHGPRPADLRSASSTARRACSRRAATAGATIAAGGEHTTACTCSRRSSPTSRPRWRSSRRRSSARCSPRRRSTDDARRDRARQRHRLRPRRRRLDARPRAARTGSPRASAPARCSSTATASAAASSCRSAA